MDEGIHLIIQKYFKEAHRNSQESLEWKIMYAKVIVRKRRKVLVVGIVTMLLLVGIIIVPSNASAKCIPPPSGLVGWWPGDGNTDDIQGGNHGTAQGATYAEGYVTSGNGQAFNFDGTNDYVSINGTNLKNLQSGTIMAWVKGGGTIISTETNSSNRRQFPIVFSWDKIYVTGVDSEDNHVFSSVSENTFTPRGLYHIAYTSVQGSGKFSLYVDGVLQDMSFSHGSETDFFFADVMDKDDNIQLGAKSDNGFLHRDFFNGQIDELAIFDRALEDYEIQAVYDAGTHGMRKSLALSPLYVGNVVVDLEWCQYTGFDFKSYNVYRGGNKIADINNQNTVFYRDSGLIRDTIYEYKIEVIDSNQKVLEEDNFSVTTGKVHGTITQSTTWSPATGVYNLSDDVTVAGGTLTISPGTDVEWSDGEEISIDGANGGSIDSLVDVSFEGEGQLDISNINDFAITLCSFKKLIQNHYVIYLRYCKDFIFQVNTITGGGIHLQNSDQSVVFGNILDGNSGKYGIWIDESDDALIKENTCQNYERGIHGSNSRNCNIIENNNIHDNSYGIYFDGIEDSVIKDNSIEKNSVSGMYIISGMNNMIQNNEIMANHEGITFYKSDRNTVVHNRLETNQFGFWCQDGNNNVIYDNYFDNPTNAHDSNGENSWNIAKTLAKNIVGGPYVGGNFWNDYSGLDNDVDSIGDTDVPYTNSGSISIGGDYLPLIEHMINIYIKSDGSIQNENGDEITPPITREGDLYTLKDNINGHLIIEKSGITIEGDGKELTFPSLVADSMGIFVDNVEKVTINNLKVNGFETGIYINGPSSGNTLSGNVISNNGVGIKLTRSNDCTIEGNEVSYNFGIGISLNDNSGVNTMEGNTVCHNDRGIVLNDNSNGNKLINKNTIEKNYDGLQLYSSENNIIQNNIISENTNSGISLIDSSNDNDISLNEISKSKYGIFLEKSNDNDILENPIYIIETCNIHIDDGSIKNIITKNILSGSSTTGRNRAGIYLSSLSSDNTITENEIGGSSIGILLESNSNTISKNKITANTNGILINSRERLPIKNTITYNSISYNSIGIGIVGPGNSKIHNNMFNFNKKQLDKVTTAGTTCTWDEFFMIPIGNYWSDYDGKDDGSPDKDTGLPRYKGDGIGDTNLPHQRVDWHPILPPRIEKIIITDALGLKNPATNCPTEFYDQYVKLEAKIISNSLFEVEKICWRGDVPFKSGPISKYNPYFYIANPKTYGDKIAICRIDYIDTQTGVKGFHEISQQFKLYFDKYGDDDGDNIPNWFEYWQKDGAVPDMNGFQYKPTIRYGSYNSITKVLSLGYGAAGQHYELPVVIPTGPFVDDLEIFGGPTRKGIDCAAEIVAHERYHKWVRDQWEYGGDFVGLVDSDRNYLPAIPFDGNLRSYNDLLPDEYEELFSKTSNANTDTYNVIKKHPVYQFYGDNELMAMRAGSKVKGDPKNDWAHFGKQSDPPHARNSPLYDVPVDGSIVSPFSDEGKDSDGDGLFDYLTINANIDVVSGGEFNIFANLTDQNSNEITWIAEPLKLNEGLQPMTLEFEGLAIRNYGVDGVYSINILLDDEFGNKIDYQYNIYNTSFYNYDDFERKDATFNNTFSDYGIDSDLDGFYDNLTIEVGLDVLVSREYIINGILYDGEGNGIESITTTFYLENGNQMIKLHFSGLNINDHRVNGPYYLKYLNVKGGSHIDFIHEAYNTSFYNFSDFQTTGIGLTGTYSDYGINADGEGEYDFLTIEATIDVEITGAYLLQGHLYDNNGEEIGMATSFAYLETGEHIIPLNVDGESIFSHGIDGPYFFKFLTIFNESFNVMHTQIYEYQTHEYRYMQFGNQEFTVIENTQLNEYVDTTAVERQVAQSFVALLSNLDGISLYLSSRYDDPCSAIIEIQTNARDEWDNDIPSGTVIASTEKSADKIPCEPSWNYFDIDRNINPGEKYWIVLKDDELVSESDYISWWQKWSWTGSGENFDSGEKAHSINNGIHWYPNPTGDRLFDLVFEDYIEPPPRISGVTPTFFNVGDTHFFSISGSNFTNETSIKFSSSGIMINSLDFLNSNELFINITIDENATLGMGDVSVTNPDNHSYTLKRSLTIYGEDVEVGLLSPTDNEEMCGIVPIEFWSFHPELNRSELFINDNLVHTWTDVGLQTFDLDTRTYPDGLITIEIFCYIGNEQDPHLLHHGEQNDPKWDEIGTSLIANVTINNAPHTSPPTTEKIVSDPKGGPNDEWVTSNSQIILLSNNHHCLYINDTYHRVWNKGIWSNWMNDTDSLTLSGEGTHFLEYYSTNQTGTNDTIQNQTHYVDNTPPITIMEIGEPKLQIGMDITITTDTPIHFKITDTGSNGGVGNFSLYYHIWYDNSWSKWYDGSLNTNVTFTLGSAFLTGDGMYYVEFYAVDGLGNQEMVKNSTLTVDNTPPETIIEFGDPYYTVEGKYWIASQTPISFNVSDSGLFSAENFTIFYRIWYNNSWTPWNQGLLNTNVTFSLGNDFSSGNGLHFIEIYSKDKLGNQEIVQNISLIVDNIPPETIIEFGDPYHTEEGIDWITSNTHIYINVTDSGPLSVNNFIIYYRLWYNDTWTLWYNGSLNTNVILSFEDIGPFSVINIEYYSVDSLGNMESSHNDTMQMKSKQTSISSSTENERSRTILYLLIIILAGLFIALYYVIRSSSLSPKNS